DDGITPTPVISHYVLRYNRKKTAGLADGIVVTPSHNPPEDGGFKYDPPQGGPAPAEATDWIGNRANQLLRQRNAGVKRVPYATALAAATTRAVDFMGGYVDDLGNAVDMAAIARAGLRLGADPLGGASLPYWDAIAQRYGIEIDVVNRALDPTFSFMTVDWDGRIRMDCSSPYAMRRLVQFKDRYDVAFACDTDADRHGIVTRSAGLLDPNHYLAAAIGYLLEHRPEWPRESAIGKTVVSSSIIDRVVAGLGRTLCEVPVGFKWFVDGLIGASLCFGGEESAGASFLRRDGSVWTTDKDGILMALLAAEIAAVTGNDPGAHYAGIAQRYGTPYYARVDAKATPEEKSRLAKLAPSAVTATTLAGEPIVAKLANAPGNGAPIGGLKVVTANGWFAARPSGTEAVYKIYGESFTGERHLEAIFEEAEAIVKEALKAPVPS
ncbi:MAG TPA: hypothetical protein VMF61_09755, partial [Candidatus Acidoferrales bacterium]|nr:hypothetical protein [Candidatus Acidoferrales bacterium]